MELAQKIAVPVTCIIIALFGAPLATSTQRGGAAYGIAISLATTVLFLMMIQLTKAVGAKGLIPPYLAAWIPNVIFAIAGDLPAGSRADMSASVFSDGPGEGGTGDIGRAPLSTPSSGCDRELGVHDHPQLVRGRRARAGTICATSCAALAEPGTYLPETLKQMRAIGVDSLPLASLVAAFIGSVIALQSRYQLFPGVQLSVVGLISRQMIILELGPLLTGLVLAGRVGAQMTAEIGTMRVTEQIDALETLAYDPMAYLVVPRIIAGLIMLPVLTVYADAIGIWSAFLTSTVRHRHPLFRLSRRPALGFSQFQLFYSLLKAVMFGGAISFLCTYEGYTASAGAGGRRQGRRPRRSSSRRCGSSCSMRSRPGSWPNTSRHETSRQCAGRRGASPSGHRTARRQRVAGPRRPADRLSAVRTVSLGLRDQAGPVGVAGGRGRRLRR